MSVGIVLGAAVAVFGLVVAIGKKVSLLHSRRNAMVRPEDVRPYTLLMGIGVALVGGGLIAKELLDMHVGGSVGWIVFTAAAAVGFILMAIAQKKYNGSFGG